MKILAKSNETMATNLEFKAQFQSLDELYPRLADLNAMHHETVDQIDTYFHVGSSGQRSAVSSQRSELTRTPGVPARYWGGT